MSKINDGGPAFPHETHHGERLPFGTGMTLREYFAGRAMQAALTGLWSNPEMGGCSPSMIANEAVQHADALIVELNKEIKP